MIEQGEGSDYIIDDVPVPTGAESEPVEEQPQPVEVEQEQEEGSADEVSEAPEEQKRKPGSQREREKRKALEAELASIRAEVAALKGGNTNAPVVSHQVKLADFESVEEFLDAREQAREQSRQQQELSKSWAEREKAARAKHTDFEDAFEDFVSARPSPALVEALIESPVGPELARHLGNNLEELDRIKALSPRRQVVELGKLEYKLTQPVAKRSSAPEPIKPVKTSASAVVAKSGSKYIEY